MASSSRTSLSGWIAVGLRAGKLPAQVGVFQQGVGMAVELGGIGVKQAINAFFNDGVVAGDIRGEDWPAENGCFQQRVRHPFAIRIVENHVSLAHQRRHRCRWHGADPDRPGTRLQCRLEACAVVGIEDGAAENEAQRRVIRRHGIEHLQQFKIPLDRADAGRMQQQERIGGDSVTLAQGKWRVAKNYPWRMAMQTRCEIGLLAQGLEGQGILGEDSGCTAQDMANDRPLRGIVDPFMDIGAGQGDNEWAGKTAGQERAAGPVGVQQVNDFRSESAQLSRRECLERIGFQHGHRMAKGRQSRPVTLGGKVIAGGSVLTRNDDYDTQGNSPKWIRRISRSRIDCRSAGAHRADSSFFRCVPEKGRGRSG